jgi:hypothetical protein
MPDPAGPNGASSATPPPPIDERQLPRLPARPPDDGREMYVTRPLVTRAYRPEAEREALVRRRADPWWRRILRFLVVSALLAGILIGGYFAVDALIGYLDRDRLPAPGVDSADVLSATYHVQSGPAAGGLVGDITVDHVNDAYRFQGAADTDLAGVEIVGDAAGRLALRHGEGPWAAGWADPRAQRLVALVPYLDVVDTDDVLTTTWRDGYVAIDDRETDVPAAGVDETTMYAVFFDAARYAADHPFQWDEWVATVLPLPAAVDDTLVTMWVDDDDVIRRFENAAAELRWERVTYSADPVTIDFPLA